VADKSAAAREVWRVLRPGGRFVIADLVLRREMPPRLHALWTAALFELVEPQRLLRILTAAGLVVTEDRDITDQTNRTWPELARLFPELGAEVQGETEPREGPRSSFVACVQSHDECADYVGHRLIMARKPHAGAITDERGS
jgi:SAM-dependent methyltransferase